MERCASASPLLSAALPRLSSRLLASSLLPSFPTPVKTLPPLCPPPPPLRTRRHRFPSPPTPPGFPSLAAASLESRPCHCVLPFSLPRGALEEAPRCHRPSALRRARRTRRAQSSSWTPSTTTSPRSRPPCAPPR